MNQNINLRVFKRNEEHIILFWSTESLNDDQSTNIKLFLLDRSEEIEESSEATAKEIKGAREIKFSSTDTTKEKELNTAKNVAIAIIDHVENGIDPNKSILVKMELGLGSKLTSFLRVSPTGVLPYFEKDSKNQNSHLFGFCKEKNRWGKVPLVKTKDGGYAIAVKLVE